MTQRFCAACGKPFQPHSHVTRQSYCSSAECQGERRRKWQKEKMKSDADYRDNQIRAQNEWRKRNPDYWKKYRELNTEYAERNRSQQRSRNKRRNDIAKMDELGFVPPIPSGIYRLTKIDTQEFVKSDEWVVEINVLSSPYLPLSKIAKR